MSQDVSGHGAPVDRIDPARSLCVLIGVDDYQHFDTLRSVRHNLTGLRAALTDPEIWGIPADRVIVVRNPRDAAALTGPIRAAAERAEDTLLVYYAGHGLFDRHERQLHLTLPASEEDRPETCVRSADLRRAIRDQGAARRRMLLLDCCYSGHVVTEMAPGDAGRQGSAAAVRTLRDVEGSYVMASTPRDRPAHAPFPEHPTVFTGALLDVLREGVPEGPELLSPHEVFLAVRDRIAALRPEVPQEPQDQSANGVGDLPFIRNRAVLPSLAPPAPAAPAVSRRRLLARTAVALVLGLLAGFGLRPLVADGADQLFPEAAKPAKGRCSAHASLLDHSDALNKNEDNYDAVRGLSALGLLPREPGTAIAVADNEPGRYFTIRLGPADKLGVAVRGARALTRADGGSFPAWYDAEGLAIEKGGRTMLVSSEAGPSIRRFDIATGHQIGEDLEIPKPLRYWPEGSAQMGRTIESLALSPDGRYLYAGWEAQLASDGDTRGRGLLRIQRYRGTPGGTYTPDRQYGYMASDGLSLVDLTAVNSHQLLALERQYTAGLGNAIKVVRIELRGAVDVTKKESLFRLPPESFTRRTTLLDLAACPSGSPGQVARPPGKVGDALVDNVEGMTLGEPWTSGPYKGKRPLYLLSDDNGSPQQVTRVYGLAVDV